MPVLHSEKHVTRKFKLVQRWGDSETPSRVIVSQQTNLLVFLSSYLASSNLVHFLKIMKYLSSKKRLILSLIYYFPLHGNEKLVQELRIKI